MYFVNHNTVSLNIFALLNMNTNIIWCQLKPIWDLIISIIDILNIITYHPLLFLNLVSEFIQTLKSWIPFTSLFFLTYELLLILSITKWYQNPLHIHGFLWCIQVQTISRRITKENRNSGCLQRSKEAGSEMKRTWLLSIVYSLLVF